MAARGYYEERLAGERLEACYALAPARTRQYLEAEIAHALEGIERGWRVLELGCGYGRILERLAGRTARVAGVDTSRTSLRLARRGLSRAPGVRLAAMNAAALGFSDGVFDCTLCLQNGISAFHEDRGQLVREAVRVTRTGGRVLFSTYAAAFWPHRLAWFEAQAAAGLLGAIDYEATRDGVIVCRDGFCSSTASADEFLALVKGAGQEASLVEVDGSSLFCEIAVRRLHRDAGFGT